MKEIIIDFDKMSDTKEVYGQKPSKFYSGFVYALVGILLTSVLYSCIGRIEMVAHASGVVRPNDDVSSVSSVAGGKVKHIYYSDGQNVAKGDVLYVLDTAESEIALKNMLAQKEEYEFQIKMNNNFVRGVRDNKNPFSSDIDSPEYKYYIGFEQYLLNLRNTEVKAEFDLSQTYTTLDSAGKQIADIDYHIDGLNQYRNSIESGTNTVSGYPEYADQYLLYENTAQTLQHDYEAKRREIEISTAEQENAYNLEYYRNLKGDYDYLIRSVENGYSVFPAGDTGYAKSLFDDYINTYNSYLNSASNANELYNAKLVDRDSTMAAENELKEEKKKLDGYTVFRDSVNAGIDYFSITTGGSDYRYLYDDYLVNLNTFETAVSDAEIALNNASASIMPDPDEIASLTEAYNLAVSARDEFKTTAITNINNTITNLQTSIAQKESALLYGTTDIDVINAKTQKDNAELTADSYKSKMMAQCKQTADELDQKIRSLENSINGTKAKNEQLSDLDTSYRDSRDNQYHQTLSQIESTIDSLEKERLSVEANKRLNEVMREMYESSVDDNGVFLNVSMITVNQLSSILSEIDALETQLKNLEAQIGQTETQIEQATVVAERDGVVNAAIEITEGDIVSSGTVVATIIPGGESEYRVQMYVSNADIGNLQVGDTIKYSLAALPRNQYGVVDGVITSISQDALVQNGEYSGYFLVEGTIDNTELVDKDGNVGNITIGMQSDARIVTEKKVIIRYLLEKIDLF